MTHLISIIIPCRNEAGYIARCLDTILQQDFPKENFEILVMDGESSDGTKGILDGYAKVNPNIRLLCNPGKITPCALNIGIKQAKGDIIIRMDAHALYEKITLRSVLNI